jgi:hypothetical protein
MFQHGRPRVLALLRANQLGGVEPDAWTASAWWKRESDIPDDVYFRAWRRCSGRLSGEVEAAARRDDRAWTT